MPSSDARSAATTRRVLLAALVASSACSEPARPTAGAAGSAPRALFRSAADEALDAFPREGRGAPAAWAAPPRFAATPATEPAIRCVPDGELGDWPAENDAAWVPVTDGPAGARPPGPEDLAARVAFAGYARGLCFAAVVTDDAHRPAAHAAALARSDFVELALWPESAGPRARRLAPGSTLAEVYGVRLRLGTQRQLVAFTRPAAEPWREAQVSSAGVTTPTGYRVEARLPIETLTPLLGPQVTAVRYEVTLHDADAEQEPAAPALRLAGRIALAPPMTVPEPIQERVSLRVCMAAEPDAVIGYHNGWRCSVPYAVDHVSPDDTEAAPAVRLGHARTLSRPRFQYLRERIVFLNIDGARRGVVALLDRRDRILSLLRVGVLGSRDPGNPQVKHSDAVPVKLPDGTWAAAVTHAYPVSGAGARCDAAHRVYASLIALRGALESTPERPAPSPPPPRSLAEIFRVTLEDCAETSAAEWTLSEDRRTIGVQDLVTPTQPARRFTFEDGWYQPLAGE